SPFLPAYILAWALGAVFDAITLGLTSSTLAENDWWGFHLVRASSRLKLSLESGRSTPRTAEHRSQITSPAPLFVFYWARRLLPLSWLTCVGMRMHRDASVVADMRAARRKRTKGRLKARSTPSLRSSFVVAIRSRPRYIPGTGPALQPPRLLPLAVSTGYIVERILLPSPGLAADGRPLPKRMT
ncbi:hypothetical protein E4U61_004395, partial [Claviceps capensis]